MTKTTNVHLEYLIGELKKESALQKASIWKRIAIDLEKPTRERRIVNISRLNRFTKANEVIVVPGKVLGSGTMNHALTVAAWDFSETARSLIEKAQGKCVSIRDLLKMSPQGKNVRIMG